MPSAAFVSWIQHAIFAIFGIGFVAWAAVVWNASDMVKVQQAQMRADEDRMERMQQQLDAVQHIADQASGIHATLQTGQANMQDQINRRFGEVQRDIERIENRKR